MSHGNDVGTEAAHTTAAHRESPPRAQTRRPKAREPERRAAQGRIERETMPPVIRAASRVGITAWVAAWLGVCAGAAEGCASGTTTPVCTSIGDCPLGSYCRDDGTCGADCTSDTQCVSTRGRGAYCTSFGQCAGGSDGGATDAGPADGGEDDAARADAEAHDAEAPDAGSPDASAEDAGGTDGDAPDGGIPDASAADAGTDGSARDAGGPDASGADAGADAGSDGATGRPYRHTIVVDGANDFTAPNEQFITTTFGFPAFVAWDDAFLYVAYDNTDVASGSATKFVLLYFDVDGSASGTASGELYRTQRTALPFRADYHLRWKADGTFTQLMRWNESAGVWQATADPISAERRGSFVELAVPRAALGTPATLGLLGFMINEAEFAESTFAGFPTRAARPSFVDGYRAEPTQWLEVDWASPLVPADPARIRP
jgi:hypothetical protein